ncbi:HEAT repeat domain-containing protein [Nonomuraea candida]|uniref:HEAT repeat domain-containing protein n=1 Tax=Nonomuraea candida TaxID=359159 RepID=UPI0012F7A6E7|nr:HEAT repeat domain-containing protein [Nonomuraea candida]
MNAPVVLSRDSMDEIPGVGALRLLHGEERTEAEDILIARLGEGDGRAAAALAEAGCVRAIPALVEATAETEAPIMRVFAARALLDLGSDAGLPALVRMLRTHDGTGGDRASAARLLAESPAPDKELLLDVATTDPDSTARSGATHALLAVAGLDDEELTSGEVLLSIAGRLLSSLTTVRAGAAAELRAVLAGREAGRTAEELGLTWHADRDGPLGRFIDDLGGSGGDLRVEGLAELTGRERVLLENLVLLRLDTDRRAIRAAARLGVRRAIEPLREGLGSAKGRTREEILSALDTLTT